MMTQPAFNFVYQYQSQAPQQMMMQPEFEMMQHHQMMEQQPGSDKKPIFLVPLRNHMMNNNII